ncbi:MAG: hypothetical protein ACHQ7M_10805 [Chloroflexota bacterium]
MDHLTRRRFLGWTTAGAAGAGLLALAPSLTRRAAAPAPSTSVPALAPAAGFSLPDSSEPVVAYVHNAASGDISLMVGTREVVLHDPDLVARLLHRASGAR